MLAASLVRNSLSTFDVALVGFLLTVYQMNLKNPFFRSLWLISLLVWLISAVVSPAAILDVSATTTLSYTDFSKDLLLPLFDPTLGQLEGVQLTVTGQLVGGGEYENGNAHSSQAGTMKYVLDQSVNVTQGAANYLTMSASTTNSFQVPVLPSFDGILDYAGTSGASFQGINTTQTQTFAYNSPANLAAFTGLGQDRFTANANAFATIQATSLNGVWFGTYSKADVTVNLQYTYQPTVAAVPEPGLAGLLGLGGLGLLVVRRFQKKRTV